MSHTRTGRRRLLTIALALCWAVAGVQAISDGSNQATSRGRLVAILIDDLHIEFKLTTSVRQMLRVISTALLREGDEFAIRSTGYSEIHLLATGDRTRFAQTILKVQGGGLTDADIQRGGTAAANSVSGRAAVTSEIVQEFAGELRLTADRPKVFLCISPEESASSITRLANGAGLPAYVLDPRKFLNARAEFDILLAKINAEIR